MRPQLRPGVPLIWRTDTLLQFGIDPERAVAARVTAAEHTWLTSLDGSLPAHTAVAAAADDGIPGETAYGLLALLQQIGGLEDAGRDVPELRTASANERSRLAPDVAAMALAAGTPGSGCVAMTARRAARVEVRGSGRVAAATATLLAATGIGALHLDGGPASSEPTPFTAGLGPAPNLRAAVERCAPSTRVTETIGVRTDPCRPHVVVLADRVHVDPEETAELVAADVPHLQVHAAGHRAVVGPLVVPGRTACLRCVFLARRDRDPTWPRQAAQLARQAKPAPVDVVLATLAGALAVRRVCGVLESAARTGGSGDLPGAGTTIEFDLATQRFTTRAWQPHPICGCTWPG